MKSNSLYLVGICILAVLLCGCASLNGDVPFRYQPSLLPATKTIEKTAGMNLLIDKRPHGDVAYTESIKDVTEKITSKLIEDFEESRLFKDIHFSVQTDDDLIIEGSVNRFMWKMYATPITYIPLLNIIIYFGVPCNEAYGVVDISLVVKEAASGKVLATFQADSKVVNSYSLYNFKAGEAGAELSEAFRNVAKELKEQISQNIR
jgi:hypothetical protein